MSTDPNRIRSEAVQFFQWSRFNLRKLVESLPEQAKTELTAGRIPQSLFELVESRWLERLQTTLPAEERRAAIRKALPCNADYDTYMNAGYADLERLPRRILSGVRREHLLRQKVNCSNFRRNGGRKRLEEYVRVWQSRSRAMHKLMINALRYQEKPAGGACLGGVEVDVERMMLSQVEATGSAMQVRGLLWFIRSLWEQEKTMLVKTGRSNVHPTAADWASGYERRVVPNPAMCEKRLNRFLIKLGRALSATSKRRALPDWTHMDQTIRFLVHGWCENIIVDDESWPMLCFLTTPALAQFLSLCTPPRWKKHQDPRTLERRITRLGLVRIRTAARIKHVRKTASGFHFS